MGLQLVGPPGGEARLLQMANQLCERHPEATKVRIAPQA
jgi:Asp-tRNA(Asn)/Glu-tRNA(Gln) amidotransferase A subunit family amidase